MKKNTVLDLVRQMPDEIDIDDLFDTLFLFHKIEQGEAAAAAGDVIPHAEVEKLIDEWLK